MHTGIFYAHSAKEPACPSVSLDVSLLVDKKMLLSTATGPSDFHETARAVPEKEVFLPMHLRAAVKPS